MTEPNEDLIWVGNIRAELARRRMSQAELARRMGMTQQSLSARLRGETPISVDELHSIAQLLEVDPRKLLVAS